MFDLGHAKLFLLKFTYIMNILSELSNTVPCRCWRSQYSHRLRYPLNAHICRYTAEIHSNIRALPFVYFISFVWTSKSDFLSWCLLISTVMTNYKMLDRICSVHMLRSRSAIKMSNYLIHHEEIFFDLTKNQQHTVWNQLLRQ